MPFPYGRLLHSQSININKLRVMHNTTLRTVTGCAQDTNIQHLHEETLILPMFNNGHFTTNIPTDLHTVTTTDIKTNMCHIHTYIVSRHIATRGNDKILRTPPPHISRSEEILPRLTGHTLSQLRTYKSPFLKTYRSTPNHTHQHSHSRHTSSLQPHQHTHHIVTHGLVDRPYRSDCSAGQLDGEAD